MKTIERSVVTTSPYAWIIKGGPRFEFPNGEKEAGIACCVSKVDAKHTEEVKREMLTREIEELEETVKVSDNPLRSKVASQVYNTNIMFFHLKEVEEGGVEPIYFVFGDDAPLSLSLEDVDLLGEHQRRTDCSDCNLAYCHEYKYREYCVAAVKRYWNKTKCTANTKGAYIVYLAHYN